MPQTVEEAADSVNDCLRTVQAAKRRNAAEVSRKLIKCTDETQESGDAAKIAIDAIADEEMKGVLRKASEDPIVRIQLLEAKYQDVLPEHYKNREEFFDISKFVRSSCLPTEVDITPD